MNKSYLPVSKKKHQLSFALYIPVGFITSYKELFA